MDPAPTALRLVWLAEVLTFCLESRLCLRYILSWAPETFFGGRSVPVRSTSPRKPKRTLFSLARPSDRVTPNLFGGPVLGEAPTFSFVPVPLPPAAEGRPEHQ